MRLDQTVHICRRTTWRPRFYLCGSVGKRKSNAPEVLVVEAPMGGGALCRYFRM